MRIALKVHIHSNKGLNQGLPYLLELFQKYNLHVSFFFSMDPALDRTVFRWRKTHFNRQDGLLAAMQAGHEIGLLGGYRYRQWLKKAAYSNMDWTNYQVSLAVDQFIEYMGFAPTCFAAPHWQLNAHLLEIEKKMGFHYASDVRGKFPFYPRLQSVQSQCVQIPVTLPTLEEVLNQEGVNAKNVHEYLYSESRHILPAGHVYQLDAELEGIQYRDIMEKLIIMWRGQEGEIKPLGHILSQLDKQQLPIHQIGWQKSENKRSYFNKWPDYVMTQSIRVSP